LLVVEPAEYPAAVARGRLRRTAFSYGWTAVCCIEAIGVQTLRREAGAMAKLERRWAEALISSWKMDLRAIGTDRVPDDRVCVIVANHQSYLDVIALFATVPVTPVFLAKRELERAPLLGRAMKLGGHVFVDRGKHDRAMESMERAARALRPGEPLAIFPEGTRAQAPGIRPFKKGAFHLAKSAGACIVPVGIRGSLEAWPRSEATPLPNRTVHLSVGMPISQSDVSALPLEALIARAQSEVAALAQLPLLDG
jgi:1-acyl-sn-glycerol-3-phosphate acyltransferase